MLTKSTVSVCLRIIKMLTVAFHGSNNLKFYGLVFTVSKAYWKMQNLHETPRKFPHWITKSSSSSFQGYKKSILNGGVTAKCLQVMPKCRPKEFAVPRIYYHACSSQFLIDKLMLHDPHFPVLEFWRQWNVASTVYNPWRHLVVYLLPEVRHRTERLS